MAKKDYFKGRTVLKRPGHYIDEAAEEIERVKNNHPLVEYFESKGVKLLKTGNDNEYKGLCPFHNDKNPSLSINRDKQVFNCFGCGKKGSVIDAATYFENITISEAIKQLSGRADNNRRIDEATAESYPSPIISGESNHPADKPHEQIVPMVSHDTPQDYFSLLNRLPNNDTPKDNDNSHDPLSNLTNPTLSMQTPHDLPCPSITLNTIADYYHKKIYESGEAQDYISRYPKSAHKVLKWFKAGFSDGKVLELLSDKQKEEFKTCGILESDNTSYHDRYLNSLVFPLYDDNEIIKALYGINITTGEYIKPLDEKEGLFFNGKALKVYRESVILAEDLLQLLDLMESDYDNVITTGLGANFNIKHLDKLKNERIKEVIITAKEHQDAAQAICEVLSTEGITAKLIPLQKAVKNKKEWEELLKNALLFTPDKAEFKVKKEKDRYIFMIGEITYKLSGVKESFVNSLKVNIRAEMNNNWFPDNLELFASRSRQSYANNLGSRFNIEPKRIEKDLLLILDYLEKEMMKRLESNAEEEITEMTEEEKKEGIRFLEDADLIENIVKDITKLGYQGEKDNKLMMYLIGISRFMPKPLNCYVLSNPGVGKSYLVDTVIKLFPKESLRFTGSLSDQAFHYMTDEEFNGKIFIMGEALHNPIVEGYIRQMQTENKLSRSVVKKDEKTGEMRTKNFTHDVYSVFMSTSTDENEDVENLSRCIVLRIDESKGQTEDVLKEQRNNERWENQIKNQYENPAIIKKHQNSQRLLRNVKIYNPYAESIRFPNFHAIFRRNQPYFLILIKVIAFLRQYQKKTEKKLNPYTHEEEEWICVDEKDYETARMLFIGCNVLSGFTEPSAKMIKVYEELHKMVKSKAKKEGLKVPEVTFIQSEVRELEDLLMGKDSIKKYLRQLVDFEYLQIVSGKKHGTRISYRLREDKSIKTIDASSIIPTFNEVLRIMESNTIKTGEFPSYPHEDLDNG